MKSTVQSPQIIEKTRKKGIFPLMIGAAFILSGVIAKRIFHHWDLLVFLHVVGASFLLFGLVESFQKPSS